MKHKKIIWFLLIYTLAFTLPVAIYFFTRIPGKYADTYQVWGKTLEFRNLISDRGILRTFKWQAENFRFTPIETIGWVQYFTNPKVGYNLSWIFSFFISAVGMYLLAYYLTRNRWAAVLAAIVFAFSPFHFSQAISTNIGTMHYEWVPFVILFLLRFLRNLRFWDFILLTVFLVILALTEHQLLAFTLVLMVLLILAFLVKNYRTILKGRFWLYGLGSLLLLFVSVRFIFGGMFEVADSKDNYLDPGSDQVRRYSADAVDLIVPSALHPLWGQELNVHREDTEANSMGRQSNYIGYAVLLLSIISLLGVRRRWGVKAFFVFTGVFFTVLSLGPYLHWKGEIYENIWMPYTFLYKYVPYWYIIRTVNRIFVVALLGFSVSAAFGLDNLFRLFGFGKGEKKEMEQRAELKEKVPELLREKQKKKKEEKEPRITKPLLFLWLFFVLIISLEYLSLPVPTLKLDYSGFYDKLAEEKGDFSIIDIPGSTSYDYASKLMFFDQIHRKHDYAGLDFARVIEDKWDMQRNTPVIYDLLYSLPTGGTPPSKEIINDYYYSLATKILNFYNIKYVVVSRAYLEDDKKFDGPSYENAINFLDGQFNSERVWEDDYLVAYEIKESDHLNGWFLAMDLVGDNWDSKEGARGSVARWARDGAKLRLVNMGTVAKDIHFSFNTGIRNLRTVQVYLNGALQEEFKIEEEDEHHEVYLRQVQPGENEILFRIFDPSGKPVETYQLSRGVKFSDLRTSEAGQ